MLSNEPPMDTQQQSPPVIEVSDLGKTYTVWTHPSARLKHPFLQLLGEMFPPARPWVRSKLSGLCTNFQALGSVSFSIGRGQAVGIIGKNGSGKSTLLQMIAGTLTPSAGASRVEGRVGALLELGSGFNPDFSGRENVFMSASLYGLSAKQTAERYDAIVDFSEIAAFMDQPVKTYSSGMLMRLAFAVTTQIQADVLIVDEALSVGDARFQKKCFAFFKNFVRSGGTLLFVSHDIGTIIDVCDRALLFHEGRLVADTDPLHASRLYHKLLFDSGDNTMDAAAMSESKVRYGDRKLAVEEVAVLQEGLEGDGPLQVGQPWSVEFKVVCREATNKPSAYGILITNRRGQEIFGTSSRDHQCIIPSAKAGEVFVCRMDFRGNLVPGDYFISAALAPLETKEGEPDFHDFLFDEILITVAGTPKCFTTCLIDLEPELSINKA